MALRSPRGSAMNIAPTEVSMVPVIKGQIPKCLEAKRGVHLVLPKNSRRDTSWKKSTASKRSTDTMPMVVKMETVAQPSRTILISASGRYRFHLGPANETRLRCNRLVPLSLIELMSIRLLTERDTLRARISSSHPIRGRRHPVEDRASGGCFGYWEAP